MTPIELLASELDAYADQTGRPELLRSAAVALRDAAAERMRVLYAVREIAGTEIALKALDATAPK